MNNWTTLLPSGQYIYGRELNEDYLVNSNYVIISDADVLNLRKGVRNGKFVIDQELIPLGFSFAEGIGWQCIYSIN
jgi:hypothetical protein